MFWNREIECMPREQMRQLQGQRLVALVKYVYDHVPFYRKKMDDLGLQPGDIRSIDDITKLPFTTKQDLRDNYPFGLQAAPADRIVRIHASRGTTGNPTSVGYTRKDIEVWAECVSRCLTAAHMDKNDRFSVSYGYGLFTGGLGLH